MLTKTMNQPKSTPSSKPFEEKFLSCWQIIENTIKKQQTEILTFLSTFNLKKQIEEFSVLGLSIFKGSKVILDEKEEYKLVKMFEPMQIDSVQLLYRASQNSFKLDKFIHKCLDTSNTLTVCETQHGKVIGGYTPLTWNDSEKLRAVNDKSRKSFTFSLTNNHKFILDTQKTAIFLGYNQPSFGDMSPDFSISEQGNKNDCYSRINRSYSNENYIKCNAESYFSFNGDPRKSYTFKTKQCKVYKINFKI